MATHTNANTVLILNENRERPLSTHPVLPNHVDAEGKNILFTFFVCLCVGVCVVLMSAITALSQWNFPCHPTFTPWWSLSVSVFQGKEVPSRHVNPLRVL